MGDGAAETAAPMSTEAEAEVKAKRRAEVAAQVAAAQAAQAKEAEQKTLFFGEHGGITCDGCGVSPIVGYRYRCKSCPNHDVCESCYDRWAGGTGVMENGLKKQVLSSNASDHSFALHKESGGKNFKPLVKGGGATAKSAPKVKPNDSCTCNSGKKYKKCCGAGG